MINFEIFENGHEVIMACDADGAKRLIEILELYLQKNVKEHDHIVFEDGLTQIKFSGDTKSVCPNDVTLYYLPDGVPENNR